MATQKHSPPIKGAKVLMVGAGGIGCELLKTLALSGFQDIHIIVEARDVLLHKLQKNTQESTLDTTEKDIQVEKTTQGEEISSIEKKDLTEIVNTAGRLRTDDEESTEQWSEEASISSGTFVDDPKKLEHEDDISFSDLEDVRVCSPSGSIDWVRLNSSSAIGGGHQRAGTSKERDSEGEESNDWLTVDKFD